MSNRVEMKAIAILLLLTLVGCATPKIDLDTNKMKSKQKQRVQSANQQVKDQTGTELGTTKRKTKFGIPTAPTD